jgi:peptidoglycan lytic transglycosylase
MPGIIEWSLDVLKPFARPVLVLMLAAAAPAAAQEPRLPPPLYPDVLALVDAGRADAALETLDARLQSRARGEDVPVEALILRSRLLSKAGRSRESAQSWAQVGASEPLLASFSRGEGIRAQLDAGDLQAALDAVAQFAVTVGSDILLRAAGAARSAGMLDRAAALYKQARRSAGRTSAADQAALGLAATLEQAGNPREALDVLRALQLTFRQASAYDAADGAARRLSGQLNDPAQLTEQDYDSIADRLAGIAAFRRAVDVLSEWHARFPGSPRGDHIELAILQNLYLLRANDEARQHAEALVKQHEPGAEAASAFRTLFSLDVREGKTAEVERRGNAILYGQVRGASLDQRQGVGRLLAEYLVSIGQPSRAVPVYDEVYRITKGPKDRIDLLWRMAIASLRSGNRAKAITELTQVRRLKLDSETDRATAYWLAYAQDASGARTAARALWTWLVNRYPYSYYGVRTAAKLEIPLPPPALAFPELALSAPAIAHSDYRTAALLSRAGLLSEAAFYAKRLSSTFRRDDAVALMAARAAEADGDPSVTSTLMTAYFGQYLERPATGLPEDFWQLAYPRAYWNDVSPAAARHHVDPLLMTALARQESHFDRTVKSPVGAIGLFQVMPYTAVQLDPSFPADKADELLIKPHIAAELAANLLEKNLAQFQGALLPTIASYNADKDRVDVWWNAAKGLPEDLFVDSIPYRETRGYVRQVLANYAMYQRVSAPPPSPQR